MRDFIADRERGEPISFGASLLAGKKVTPDVTELLAEDHRLVLGWFSWYEAAADARTKLQIAQRICRALRAHMAGEEEALYPQLREHGRDDLADRAQHEHEHARQIMQRIDNLDAASSELDGLVSTLATEIGRHIEEEEAELFAACRQSGMDLYAAGAAVAALRVDHLFASASPKHDGPQPTEIPSMQISRDSAREVFLLGLKNAHAVVNQGRSMVSAQVRRLEHYPDLKARFETHLEEKDAQLERIEGMLQRLGASPSSVKDAGGAAMAAMASMAAAPSDDEVIKNGLNAIGLANYEAAAFETLILFAEAAGEVDAMRPLQKCLSEERAMAAFLAAHLRPTGMRFLQLRSEGLEASH